jgi:hypothetical protein
MTNQVSRQLRFGENFPKSSSQQRNSVKEANDEVTIQITRRGAMNRMDLKTHSLSTQKQASRQ